MEPDDKERQKRKYLRRAPTKEHPLGFNKYGQPKVRRSRKQVKMGLEVIKVKPHVRVEKSNYLKYMTLVMDWAQKTSGLNLNYVGIILFLYNEDLFTHRDMKSYQYIVNLTRSRLMKLVELGWVTRIKLEGGARGIIAYELSYKGRNFATDIYRKMDGKEKLSSFRLINEAESKSNMYKDRYSLALSDFNKKVEERNQKNRHISRHGNQK